MSTSDGPATPALPKAPELAGNDLSRIASAPSGSGFPSPDQIAAWANEFFKAAGPAGATEPGLPTVPGTTSGFAAQDPSTLGRRASGQPPISPPTVPGFASIAAPVELASDPMIGPNLNLRPDFVSQSIVASPTLGGVDPIGRGSAIPSPQALGRQTLAGLSPSAAPSVPFYFLQQGNGTGGALPAPTSVDLEKLHVDPLQLSAAKGTGYTTALADAAGSRAAPGLPNAAGYAPSAAQTASYGPAAPDAGYAALPNVDAWRGFSGTDPQDAAALAPAASGAALPATSIDLDKLYLDPLQLSAASPKSAVPNAAAFHGYDALSTPAGVQDLTPSYARGRDAGRSQDFTPTHAREQRATSGSAPAPVKEFTPTDAARPATPSARTGAPIDARPSTQASYDPRAQGAARPGQFDVEAVRRDFPILSERVNGRQLVWLDNAATTQKPRVVIDRLSYFYAHENSNIHRAAHSLAARSTDAYENARESVRRFLNAGSTEEIVFVRGTTEGINLIANAWGGRFIEAGDEIIVTRIEHHSNIVPWQMLCARTGAKLRVAEVDDTGQVQLDQYERLFNQHTRLVSFTQVSNALGTILPVAAMTQIAHRYGARVVIDGAQSVCHMRVDVQQLDADFFVFSGHKVFGPTGIGVVYGKKAILQSMPPYQGGGNMIGDVTFEKTEYQPPPARFEAGTGNIADAVGLGVALDYLEGLGLENVARHEHDLLEYGTHKLQQVPGLQLVGTAAEKAAVLGFVLENMSSIEVGAALAANGIAVRAGHHCALPALRRFGHETTVRPSLAVYNNKADIDALVATLHDLQSRWLR